MKKLFLFLILLAFCGNCFAQNGDGFGFGARVGLNMSDITNSTGKSRFGIQIGAFADYNFSRLGMEVAASYSQLGANDIVTSGVTDYKRDLHIDYILIDARVKYQIFNGFRVFLGPQFSILTTAHKTINGITAKVTDEYTPFGVGVNAGVGYTFSFGMDIKASYSRALFEHSKTSSKQYNSGFNVSIGYRF